MAAPATSAKPSLIPLSVADAPTQRLWVTSSVLAIQAYKLYLFLTPYASLPAALLIDLAVVLIVARLRIPRIDYSDAKWAAVGLAAATLDWALLGGWRTLLSFIGLGSLSSWSASLLGDIFSRPLSISEHRVRISDLISPSTHLLGQHTIHVLPYSTATFSASTASCHCIGAGTQEIKIPVTFNNTDPHVLQYSVTSFEDPSSHMLYNVTIPRDGLIAIASQDQTGDSAEESEWDQVEAEVVGSKPLVRRDANGGRGAKLSEPRSRTRGHDGQQKVFHLPIKHVGRIRLERVMDRSRMDARIARGEILVVECPTTTMLSSSSPSDKVQGLPSVEHRCPGDRAQLDVGVRGLAPLELSYRRVRLPLEHSANQRPDTKTLSISHISNPRIVSPLVGGDVSSTDDTLAVLLDRRRASTAKAATKDFAWALPQEETVPISLDLSQPGHYEYHLESVKDACGNVVAANTHAKGVSSPSTSKKLLTGSKAPKQVAQMHTYRVHSRAEARIINCPADRPLRLLKGGPSKDIAIKATQMEAGVDWSASLRFDPEVGHSAQGWVKNVTMSKDGTAKIEAGAPGTYTLESVEGTYCSGQVRAPWSCTVIEVPPPSADISFSSIEDVCAGSVGVKAMAVLSGTPPFRLQYEISKGGRHPLRQERVIERTREEFEFRPSTEGVVQYRFTGLADANYRNIPLDGPVFEQVVHPLASAQFVQSTRGVERTKHRSKEEKLVMRSCEGSRAQAEVAFEGTGPFDLTYVVRSGSNKLNPPQHTIRNIKDKQHRLDIELPSDVNEHGGTLTVSLVSIKDGKNCERALTTSDLNIEIRRNRPTAGFALPAGTQREQHLGETHILEGHEARLPVHLEGEAPWKVEYVREDDNMVVQTTLRRPEAELAVDRPGTYKLVSVHDAFCEGTIPPELQRWNVQVKRKPTAYFDPSFGVKAKINDSLLRPAVCRGVPDSVDLLLSGSLPIEVTYEHKAPSWTAPQGEQERFFDNDGVPTHHGVRERETFSTAQNVTAFHLSTATPGWHTYQLLEVGDSNYPRASSRGDGAALWVEQMVHPLPSVAFVNSDNGHRGGKKFFCLGDSLNSQKGVAPVVQLSGTPPFTLEFELQSAARSAQASSRRFVRTGIMRNTFSLDLDSEEAKNFKFDAVGPWNFKILSLQDGNGCLTVGTPGAGEMSLGGSSAAKGVQIEVAETASIAPVGTRQDYCVGETVEYILQGSPPWTVAYAFNGQPSSASVRSPSFSRVAEKAGVLEIQSVAHQSNKCKRELSPSSSSQDAAMRKVVHPLPRVKIHDGSHYVQDLREGAHAEIVFSLEGTPPFSLTYQHLEAADVYAHPRVLETHTVAGILDKEYVLTTSMEGTWRVTWLQDRWCSVSIDGRGRQTGEGRAKLAIAAEG